MFVSGKAHKGYNLSEVMLALLYVGIISALTLPGVLYSSTDYQSLYKSKNIASQIVEAAEKRRNNDPATPPISAEEITDLMKYTVKVTDGSVSITYDPDGPTASLLPPVTVVCAPANPCYRFPDGGVLIPNQPVAWAGSVGTFLFDPDGEKPSPPTGLKMDYDTNRIAPLDAFDGTANNDAMIDPAYIKPWTKM